MMIAFFSAKWFERSVQLLLGAIFIYAAVGKIWDPAGFAQAIANYQMLPTRWVNPAALFLPWLELVCGLGLILGVCKRGCMLLVVLMLVLFTTALGYSAYRGLDIHCGCFSTDGSGAPRLWLDLARDVALLILALSVMVPYRARRGLSGQPSSELSAAGR